MSSSFALFSRVWSFATMRLADYGWLAAIDCSPSAVYHYTSSESISLAAAELTQQICTSSAMHDRAVFCVLNIEPCY